MQLFPHTIILKMLLQLIAYSISFPAALTFFFYLSVKNFQCFLYKVRLKKSESEAPHFAQNSASLLCEQVQSPRSDLPVSHWDSIYIKTFFHRPGQHTDQTTQE